MKPMMEPISMILFCPKCGQQHIDAPEPERGWYNPPHRSHLCHFCNHIWRPADVPTMGVADIKTAGDQDFPIVRRLPSGGVANLQRLEKLEAVAAAARDWHKDEFNGWSADKIVNDPQWSRAEYDYDIKLIRALAALDAQEAGNE